MPWQDNLLTSLDERRKSYGNVVNEFGKYIRNFQTVEVGGINEENDEFEESLLKPKTKKVKIKKKKNGGDLLLERNSLPSLQVIRRYQG